MSYGEGDHGPAGEPEGRSPSTLSPVVLRKRAPSVMLSRVCGPLSSLLACGFARRAEEGVVELFLNGEEAAHGGMVMISMWVPVRKNEAVVDELFSAWLAVSPGVASGAIITPSVLLPGMIKPVSFRIQVPTTRQPENAPSLANLAVVPRAPENPRRASS